jgi:quercetin dioxygenase-like cupin family protein
MSESSEPRGADLASASEFFPAFIRALPAPDSPVAMHAHIVPSDHVLTMFYEIADAVDVPAHRHGAQWGVVLAGSLELEVEGRSTRYGPGDSYFVPADALHTARLSAGYKGIDVFADADRYTPVSPAGAQR